jgi:hypothetical protein
MATFKHNKKRNAGLVYEFLVRRLSKTMIDKDKDGSQKTLGIVRKYFGEGTVLSEEKELFDVIRNTRGVSEMAARRILGEIQKQAKSLDIKKIDIKKSNLIKEINYGFGQDFWDDHRIPEYRLLATIQMIIDSARIPTQISESVQKIQLEEGLVQYMTSTGDFTVKERNQDIDKLVMALTAKKFQEKWTHSLNPAQKVILEKYIRFIATGDEETFRGFLHKRKSDMTASLNKYVSMKEFATDTVMRQKMDEAVTKFNSLPFGASDEFVQEMMLFEKLVEEIESHE